MKNDYRLVEDDNYIIKANDKYWWSSWQAMGMGFYNADSFGSGIVGQTKLAAQGIGSIILYIASAEPKFKTSKPYPYGY